MQVVLQYNTVAGAGIDKTGPFAVNITIVKVMFINPRSIERPFDGVFSTEVECGQSPRLWTCLYAAVPVTSPPPPRKEKIIKTVFTE
ncbi:MAG: hypothetical protein LBJ35_00420 [Spirochaetaceae bacterium]|jgi:hypothetical protein|nr:hypothetical protein [Spirochaetaceae bacterium]